MKILLSNGSAHEFDFTAGPPLAMYIEVSFSNDGSVWTEPAKIMIDSGSSGTLLPAAMINGLGLRVKILGTSEVEAIGASKIS